MSKMSGRKCWNSNSSHASSSSLWKPSGAKKKSETRRRRRRVSSLDFPQPSLTFQGQGLTNNWCPIPSTFTPIFMGSTAGCSFIFESVSKSENFFRVSESSKNVECEGPIRVPNDDIKISRTNHASSSWVQY